MSQQTEKPQGRLYAIGTGPGASDLITVRGARIISELDILYAPAGKKDAPSLAHTIVTPYITGNTTVKTYHFLMKASQEAKEAVWDDVAQAIQEDVADGKKVGFITLGDSMLFSTWVSLLERIGNQPWLEVIPGVTSFAAIASRAVVPLAMENQSLAVMSCTASPEELEHAVTHHECIVLMKVYGRLQQVRDLLRRHDLFDHAILMADATLETEQCWRRLDEIDDEQTLPYFSTVLINKTRK
ncbi:cobalt-precorrin-2 C(20)-methyltransferase [Morganella morganii]|uniref:Cobalt-precorrin-2 C(20)-methyltransferase n=1 Tax=Morganella morganii TaxID=582 RepID=A0A0D8L5I5_MORMO|nr:cobalt-precorrin-2 C(20)-methyltransferase [Morganella morganii]